MARGNVRNTPRGITTLPSGRFRARIMVDGVNYSLGLFDRISDAEAVLARARTQLARGVFEPPSERRARLKRERAEGQRQEVQATRTVSELADAWLSWLQARGRSAETAYTYRSRLNVHYLPTFGTRSVPTVTAEETAQWGATAPADALRNVAAMWRWAAGKTKGQSPTFERWHDDDLSAALVYRQERRKTKRNEQVATPEQVDTIAANMPPREALAVLLAGWAGLRIGEVIALRRRHLEQVETVAGPLWTVTVETQVQARGSGLREKVPKGHADTRTIPVSPRIAAAVEQHLAEHVAEDYDALLFPRRSETPTVHHHPNTLRRHFDDAVELTNAETVTANKGKPPRERVRPLRDFTFHGLRHTALTRLGESGATLADLMEFAGHSDLDSVRTYQHSSRDRLAALAGKMGATS